MKRWILIFCCLLVISPAVAGEAEPETRTLVWPDGTKYVGGVVDGKRTGKGTIFWKDGTRFVGSFRNDMRNGPGTMILPDGTVYTGYFHNDELVDPPTVEQGAPVSELEMPDDTSEAVAVAPASIARPASAPVIQPVTEITNDVKARLEESVDLWAAAWAEQNVVQYLAWYSDDFDVPDAYGSRSNWRALRRSRLNRPGDIDIDLVYQRFELIEPDIVDVTFEQTYRSDVYSDVTIKTLRLRKEGPGWKILSENTQ